MDGLIIIGLILWAAFSFMTRAAKQQKGVEQTKKQRTLTTQSDPPRPAPAPRPVPPMRTYMETPRQMERSTRIFPEGETMMPRVRFEGAGEGEDPCHEEMLQPVTGQSEDLNAAYQQVSAIPGLEIQLSRNSLLQGIVFSEILNRRVPRRRYR